MAKPGTEFEIAVFAFTKTLDPSAEVIFDHKVPDRDTGTMRQCDVWINAKFGAHWPLSILVSCKDHNRPLDVGDIEKFLGEIHSTRANTGVIYSKGGFYQPALDKAKANGISCCRLYQNQPADLPNSIVFEHFACTPSYQIVLKSNLSKTRLRTWNDLFDTAEDDKTIIDVIATETANTEQKSVEEKTQQSGFPSDWVLELVFREDDIRPEIRLDIVCRWKWYRARLEATLLNGSYCLSDETFRGTMMGPSIDMRCPHPGEAWTEITDRNFAMPANRVIVILTEGNLKDTLRESLGSKVLPVISDDRSETP